MPPRTDIEQLCLRVDGQTGHAAELGLSESLAAQNPNRLKGAQIVDLHAVIEILANVETVRPNCVPKRERERKKVR